MRMHGAGLVLGAVAILLPTLAEAQVPPGAYVNFEGAQTNPIRISGDGTRLYALNTPDNRVSVFDLTSNPASPSLIVEVPVGIEPVSVHANPANNDEVWVVNQESDSISIVSVSQGIVTDTIYCKDEPSDVVFAGNNAFVSVARSNLINVYSARTHKLVKSIPVFGESPRALAVSSDGSKVYAAFALAGSHTTILPANIAPPPPPPTNPALPPAPRTGLIVDASDPSWTWYITYTMPFNGVVAIDTGSLSVSTYYSAVGSNNLGICVQPGTGDLYVPNTSARNLIRFVSNLKGHWMDNQITRIQLSSGQVSAYNLNPGINYSVLPNPAALSTALAQPAAAVFDPSGTFLWVAAFGTDRVAKVSPTGSVLAMIEIGPATGSTVNPPAKRGPRGLALNPTAQKLYVLNRINNSISVVDTKLNTVLSEIPTGSFDPTPTVIRNGRGFLYDAKLSGNGTGSCASCHLDAEADLLAWDLGDPGGNMTKVVNNGNTFYMHPMKGPMTTRTLRGIVNTNPLHWRGDIINFLGFDAAFVNLMGGAKISTSAMTAYQNFINTVTLMPNPNQNLDRTLPTSLNGGNAVNGQNAFLTTPINPAGGSNNVCNRCHMSNPGPGSTLNIVTRSNLPQPLKIPTLRNLYQKLNFNNMANQPSIDGFGMADDGAFANALQLLADPILGGFNNQPQLQADVAAFLVSFDTGTAPAVGYTRTATQTNVSTDPTIASDWALLQNQALAGNIDLIVKGTINGQVHGLLYLPATNNYETDTTGLGPYTQTDLIGFITAGDKMSVMGVPAGSGVRMGIDRNLDGILDGDE